MPTYPSHLRKLKAVEFAIQLERMKEKEKRDLSVDSIVATARTIDAFTKESV